MNENDSTGSLVEEFLGRIRIGDVPNIDAFIAEHAPSDNLEELRGLLSTLLDVERLTFSSKDEDESLPPPDLTSCGYRLLKKIGAGGMGVVYEALQINLGRHVAVKLLRPELLADAEIRELFRLEARILARFNHPGIVRILGTGHCADTFFYTMELVEGQHLDALAHRPTEKQLLQWAVEAADALACAHNHGIVHGDIKPANLLLNDEGHIRICDFGLAFATQAPSGRRESKGGTFRYMAPELQGDMLRNFTGDQYALCASLVEIATARPFDRNGDDLQHVRNSQLAAVLSKGLSDDPKDRYPAVSDLRDDLRRIERHEPVTAGRTPLLTRIGLFCQRHPIHSVSASLIVLCLAAVIHGLIRTESALKLAQGNAATANAAIGKVFDEIVQLPPAPENAELLAQLIPYYEQIVANPNIPLTELTGGLTQLAQTALRTGDYPLAERTLRRLLESDNSSTVQCRLAYVLFQQEKDDESTALFRKIIDRYSNGAPRERLDAVWAHLHFVQTDPKGNHSADRQAARRILADYFSRNPEDDTALYLYAQLLRSGTDASVEPIPDLPSDPLEILDELSSRHPNNGRYWQAFIDGATEWLRTADATNGCPETIESALEKSDIMLWRFLSRPHAVTSALALKRAYARWHRPSDAQRKPVREQISVSILTRALLNQPNLPEEDQSDLIAFSLDALEDLERFPPRRHRPHERRQHRLTEIKTFLEQHPLPRKDEFLKRIRDLEILDAGL